MAEPTRADIATDVGYLDGHPAKMTTEQAYAHRSKHIELVRMMLDNPLISDERIWQVTLDLARERKVSPFDITRHLNGLDAPHGV